jgi:D-glycero-D-manno-heptose 1,7-bisphosphate phosphatase
VTENKLRRAAFLDRDGVVNRDIGYLHRWEDFEFLPGALDAMRKLHDAGYALVIVTNQSGIARGYYTEEDYQALTRQLRHALEQAGCPPAGIYHCPHHPGGSIGAYAIACDCRKPQPGLLLQAARELDLDLQGSLMVGDKLADAQAGRSAGVGRVYLVRSGHVLEDGAEAAADRVFEDLASCVRQVLGRP